MENRIYHNLDNYYEIDAYCKSEGLDTDYFILNLRKKNKNILKKILAFLASIFTN